MESLKQTRWQVVLILGAGLIALGLLVLLTPRTPSPAPAVTLTAEPNIAKLGQNVKLTWTSQNARELKLEPDIGKIEPQGSRDVIFKDRDSVEYTLTATGPGGTTSATATVTKLGLGGPVLPPVPLGESPADHPGSGSGSGGQGGPQNPAPLTGTGPGGRTATATEKVPAANPPSSLPGSAQFGLAVLVGDDGDACRAGSSYATDDPGLQFLRAVVTYNGAHRDQMFRLEWSYLNEERDVQNFSPAESSGQREFYYGNRKDISDWAGKYTVTLFVDGRKTQSCDFVLNAATTPQ